MSVGSVDPNSGSANAALQAKMQARAAFDQLSQSLKAGDLSGAQQAFATLQQNVPQGQANPIQNQIDALGKALQSGNLLAAQQAFAPLQGAAQAKGAPPAGRPAHGGGGGESGGSSGAKKVVSETSTTSAGGVITTTTTYSDGSKGTSTTYGPPPNSTQSVFA